MTLLKTVATVPEEKMALLGRIYLQPTTLPSRRAQILDTMIEHGSPEAQQSVIDQVSLGLSWSLALSLSLTLTRVLRF